jgi:hypothetical protein
MLAIAAALGGPVGESEWLDADWCSRSVCPTAPPMSGFAETKA